MVTIERLVAIRTPLIARTFWNHRRIAIIMITICLLTLLLQIPHSLWLKPGTIADCADPNKTTYVLVQLDIDDPMHVPLKYAITVCPMITVPIPMMLLISLNGLLIYHIRLSRRLINQLDGFMNQSFIHENEIKIASTIFIVVFTFFLFNFPSAVIYVYYIFETNHYRLQKLIAPAITTNYMVTLSKALNFPLYCCTSSNFRTQLKKIFVEMFRNHTWQKLSSDDTTSKFTTLGNKKYSRRKRTQNDSTKSQIYLTSVNESKQQSLIISNQVIIQQYL